MADLGFGGIQDSLITGGYSAHDNWSGNSGRLTLEQQDDFRRASVKAIQEAMLAGNADVSVSQASGTVAGTATEFGGVQDSPQASPAAKPTDPWSGNSARLSIEQQDDFRRANVGAIQTAMAIAGIDTYVSMGNFNVGPSQSFAMAAAGYVALDPTRFNTSTVARFGASDAGASQTLLARAGAAQTQQSGVAVDSVKASVLDDLSKT
jgi:hypothetical protein